MRHTLNLFLAPFSKFICFSTVLLIFVGALVKSHDAGLAVPDWPTTYGYQMFSFPIKDMVGGILYEHGHRIIATCVGFFTLLQGILISFTDRSRCLKIFCYVATILVFIQGLLGGITVLLLLPPFVSVVHGLLAQTFFVITIIISHCLSKEKTNQPKITVPRGLGVGATTIFFMIYFQLIVGTIARHTESGLAIPDFPTVGMMWIPTFSENMIKNINSLLFEIGHGPVNRGQILIHLIHRFIATIIAVSMLFFTIFYHSFFQINRVVRNNLWFVVAMVIFQIFLGILTVLSHLSPFITSFHVVIGALILGFWMLLILRIRLFDGIVRTKNDSC